MVQAGTATTEAAAELLRLLRVQHALKALPPEVVDAARVLVEAVKLLPIEMAGNNIRDTALELVERQGQKIRDLEARLRQKPTRPREWAELDPLLKGNPASCKTCKGTGVVYGPGPSGN